MAEVEYSGIKLSGGKLLLIIPLLSIIGGGAWSGFELYNRLLIAEETLESIDILTIQAEVNRLESIADVMQSSLQTQIQTIENQSRIDNDSIRAEFSDFSRLLRTVEGSTSETQRELRNDLYALERRVNETIRETDDDLIEMRSYLETRIEEILTNPLNIIE
tara:strand:+ start:718 stop:1203 length:486 start_codon:yes stop_codon:yes gene_type:complete